MVVRFPAPLVPGDRIAVTCPSAGVAARFRPRLEVGLEHLRRRGFDVVVGGCLQGDAVVSAPAEARAAELMAMLLDPAVAAVVPPWGGDLAVEVLPHLDLDALATAEPTWVVGYSDIATLLLPLTTVSGIATVHGPNLMDTPYRVPEPLLSWLDVVGAGARPLVQGPSSRHRSAGSDDWVAGPGATEQVLDTAGSWSLLAADPDGDDGSDVRAAGRLVGGCLETVSVLAGTPYGDVARFAAEHAADGVIVYVEASEDAALSVARHLWRLRLAGWFARATAVLVGRTRAPSSDGFSQRDAVRSALGDLGIPVVLDVDCGHVAPQMALVNGATAELTRTGGVWRLVQHLR